MRYIHVYGRVTSLTDPSGHAGTSPCLSADGEGYGAGCNASGSYKPRADDPPVSPCVAALGSEACGRISRVASVAVLVLDLMSTSVSTAGIGVELAGAFLGEAFTPFPGVDGAVGAGGRRLLYQTSLNPWEDRFSTTSLAINALNESLVTGDTRLRVGDTDYGGAGAQLTLGPDTSVSLVGLALGNNGYDVVGKEAIVDTLVNGTIVYYDLMRLTGRKPIWGLHQWQLAYTLNGHFWIDHVEP